MLDQKLLEKYALFARDQLTHAFSQQLKTLYTDQQPEIQERVRSIGFEATIEEATYTWFNRLITLRFFENNHFFAEPGHDADPWQSLATLLRATDTLSTYLPQLFPQHKSYLHLFDLEFLFAPQGIIAQLLSLPAVNFTQTEVIGWLYQYYNSSQRHAIISHRKPYTKAEIPCVTQFFTPAWIVRFLVENSLGRYYIEHTGDESLLPKWQYFTNSADLTLTSDPQFDPLNLKFLDPCCGSGHILIYAYEVLTQIYHACGHNPDDIPYLILTHNLFGFEIDDRAAEISYLALLLRARFDDANIFQKLAAHALAIIAIPESNDLGKRQLSRISDPDCFAEAEDLFNFFVEAKNLGSLLVTRSPAAFPKLSRYLQDRSEDTTLNPLRDLLCAYNLLSQKYDVIATNPPYINHRSMNQILKDYVSMHFSEAKNDLYSAFIQRCSLFLESSNTTTLKSQKSGQNAYFAFMTPSNWLFTTQFQPFRTEILSKYCITVLIQAYKHAFFDAAKVQICAFVLKNSPRGRGEFLRISAPGDIIDQQKFFLERRYEQFSHANSDFITAPDSAIMYWLSDKALKAFTELPPLSEYAEIKQGIATADNDRFLKLWFEVDPQQLDRRWLPHNKGGEYRKWYGNREYVIDWENSGRALKNFKQDRQLRARPQNLSYNFRPALSWSAISEADFAMRYYDANFTFNIAGPCCFPATENFHYLLGLLNSAAGSYFLRALNPSLNYNVGDLAKFPVYFEEASRPRIEQLVRENLSLSAQDWAAFEPHRDFRSHPLLNYPNSSTLSDNFAKWQYDCTKHFIQLRDNETKLNQIFAKIYQLESEIECTVPEDRICLQLADEKRELKSLLSFFVGQVFGRFNSPALESRKNFSPSQKSKVCRKSSGSSQTPFLILSFSDSQNRQQNIISQLEDFLVRYFPSSQLEANLAYIATALSPEFGESSRDTISRYFRESFYTDHSKTYSGRPLYWLLDSGPEHSLRALVYCHQLTPQILSNLSQKHLPALMQSYDTARTALAQRLSADNRAGNRKHLAPRLAKLERQLTELSAFQERLAALLAEPPQLDFNQGILPNYLKYQSILAPLPHPPKGRRAKKLQNHDF